MTMCQVNTAREANSMIGLKRSSAEIFVVLHRQWFAWAALFAGRHGRNDARIAEPEMRIAVFRLRA